MTGSAHGQTPPRLEHRVDDSPHVEPDEHGNRAQRRLWQRECGKRMAGMPEVEEVDLPCCEPMDEAHTLPSGHTVFCRDKKNRERA